MGRQYIGRDAVELFKSLAKGQQDGSTFSRTGLITSVDAATNMAKVMILPEGIETGWMPLSSMAIGPGWGVFHLPLANTECTVDFADGSIDNGRIRGFHANAIDAPPAGLVQGEFLLQHQSGSFIHFDTAGNVNIVTSQNLTAIVGGNVLLSAQGDLTATIQGDLTLGVQGDLTATVNGDITAAALGDADVSAVGDASLSGTNVTVTAAAAVEITASAALSVTCSAMTATVASLTATVAGVATVAAASVILGTPTTIDGVSFLEHTHSAVETGAGVSGPVVPA